MKKEFTVGNTESTYPPVSACICTALSFIDNFDSKVDSGTLTLHEVSQAIYVLEVVCVQLERGAPMLGDVAKFKQTENEHRASVLNNCTNARVKLMEALSKAVLEKADSIDWHYL